MNKLTVQELSRSELNKARNRIVAFSCLLIAPVYLVVLFYLEYKSNTQALEPILKQLAQSISMGDGISLDRINKSTLLLPRVNSSKVLLNDGYCTYATSHRHHQWNSQIQDPCENGQSDGFFPLKKIITNSQNEGIGWIEVSHELPWDYLLFFPFVALASLLLVYYLFRTTTQNIHGKLTSAVESFPELIQKEEDVDFEIYELQKTFQELKRLKRIEMDHIKSSAMNTVAAQVSHDIRSPLAALEMISGTLQNLPEDQRLIIRNSIHRIRDIANGLLELNKKQIQPPLIESRDSPWILSENAPGLHLLGAMIDSITTEKRMQFRNLVSVNIEHHPSEESYGLFALIQINELKRVLSNLINNAVESLMDERGLVCISLGPDPLDSRLARITIADNGRGIPSDRLSELGQKGKTFGKDSGNGLGLYHAYQTVQRLGGSVQIESQILEGTSVHLTLPRSETPHWFVPRLYLRPNSDVVIFDDDFSIHQLWKKRMEGLGLPHLKVHHFTTANDLKSFYRKKFLDLDHVIFLMDFEIHNNSETGLDLIEQLGIADSSILVTSRDEESEVRHRCESLNLKLIPKSMCGFVPISTEKGFEFTTVVSSPPSH